MDGGSNEAALSVAEGVTFGALLWLLFKDRLEIAGDSPYFMTVIALSIVGAAISTAFSEDLDSSVPLLIQWMWLGGTAVLALTVAGQERGRELLLAMLSTALLVQVGWSFYVWWGGQSHVRLHVGTFYAPNQFAGYVLLLAPIFLATYLLSKGIFRIFGFALLTALAYLSLFFSGSRGGAVAALFGALVAGVIALVRKGWVTLLKITALLSLFLALGFLIPLGFFVGESKIAVPFDTVLAKPETVSSSTLARTRWMQGAWQIGMNRPLTGSGLGTFGDKFSQIQDPDWRWSRYAHNHYLESLAEGGILMLLASAALPIVVIVRVAKKLGTIPPVEFQWGTGLLAGQVGASLHFFVDHDWSYPAYASAFLIAGVVALRIGRRQLGGNSPERRWRLPMAMLAGISLIALTGLSLSRGLASGDLMPARGSVSRARLASALAPYSISPILMESDELQTHCDSTAVNRAKQILRKAASIDELNPVIHWKLAYVMTQEGSFERARAYYRKSLEIAPNSVEAYLRAALFELKLGQRARANLILDEGIVRLEGTTHGLPVESLKDLREESAVHRQRQNETEHSSECSVRNS